MWDKSYILLILQVLIMIVQESTTLATLGVSPLNKSWIPFFFYKLVEGIAGTWIFKAYLSILKFLFHLSALTFLLVLTKSNGVITAAASY